MTIEIFRKSNASDIKKQWKLFKKIPNFLAFVKIFSLFIFNHDQCREFLGFIGFLGAERFSKSRSPFCGTFSDVFLKLLRNYNMFEIFLNNAAGYFHSNKDFFGRSFLLFLSWWNRLVNCKNSWIHVKPSYVDISKYPPEKLLSSYSYILVNKFI